LVVARARADDQAEPALLGGKDMLDRDPDPRPGGVAATDVGRHRSAARLRPLELGHQSAPRQQRDIGRRAGVSRWCGRDAGATPHLGVDAHDTRRTPKRQALRWHAAGRSAWRMLPDDDWPLGDIELALVERHVLLDRARLAILPRTAMVELVPEGTPGGRIVLSGFEQAQLRLEAGRLPSDVSVELQHDEPGALEVGLTCSHLPPAYVAIAVLFETGVETPIVVPFLARGGGFIDADDRSIPPHAHRSVQRLNGVRARAFGTAGERGLSAWRGLA
jgi:hypothetical protein